MSKRGGRYGCLYGDFWRHPTWVSLSPAAAGLWARSVSYCADGQTDGLFPWFLIATWSAGHDTTAAVEELIAARRWRRKGDSGEICNYGDNQPTRAEWESRAKRESAKRGERRTRAGLRLVSGADTPPDRHADTARTGGRT